MPTSNACNCTWRERSESTITTTECDYCGSISVEDAIRFLKAPGTQFSGSDQKYGWPHKYYLEPVNPEADKEVMIGSSSSDGTHSGDYWTCWAHGDHLNGNTCTCPKDKHTGTWHTPIMGQRKTLHYKFYTKHLLDCSQEVFDEFSKLSEPMFQILWGRDEKGLWYRQPKTDSFYGHQRAGYIKEDGTVVHTL